MIVDPDFFDHWRTRMLVDALGGDEMAPLYVQRIWGHCQTRKGTRFDMPAAGLKALCKYAGSAELLERSLIEAGFIVRDGAAIEVPKWAEHNAALIAAWANGATGGRPKGSANKPKENPRVPEPEPNENPTATQAKPIREDEIREKEPNGSSSPGNPTTAPVPAIPLHCPHDRIRALFAEVLPELPQPRTWEADRQKALRERWQATAKRKVWTTVDDGVAWFRLFFEAVRDDDWAMGRTPRGKGHENWVCSIDYLLSPKGFRRVVENAGRERAAA